LVEPFLLECFTPKWVASLSGRRVPFSFLAAVFLDFFVQIVPVFVVLFFGPIVACA